MGLLNVENPHKDLVGRALFVGDTVAYPTGSGSNKRMCVARIDKINGEIKTRKRFTGRYENNRGVYEDYDFYEWTVLVQPLHWNDYRATVKWGYNEEGKYTKLVENLPPKKVTLYRTDNLVKVDLNEST